MLMLPNFAFRKPLRKPVRRQDLMRNWEISSGGQKLYHNLEAWPRWAGQLRNAGTSLSAELLRTLPNRLR